MKKIEGIWLPDTDTHFEYHLKGNPTFQDKGTYQFAKIKAALDVIPDDKRRICVDVGAHVGLWSRVLAHKFEMLYAFEPVQELCECFRKNVDAVNVELIEVALGALAEDKVMVNDDISNSGNWRIGNIGIAVHVHPLDSFKYENVDFIKIDTEGTELQVLMGAINTLKKCNPFVLVEQKLGHAERYGAQQLDAVHFLMKLGAKMLWTKSGDYFMGWA
jgi:FkbM family methyltransferase